MGELSKSNLKSHSEIFRFDVFVMDSVFHKFSVESQLTDAAPYGSYYFAHTVSSTSHNRSEKR